MALLAAGVSYGNKASKEVGASLPLQSRVEVVCVALKAAGQQLKTRVGARCPVSVEQIAEALSCFLSQQVDIGLQVLHQRHAFAADHGQRCHARVTFGLG